MERWNHNFVLSWPAHCVYETEVFVIRPEDQWTEFSIPRGLAALVDAERELIALVPDKMALRNPDRPLPELLCHLLNVVGTDGVYDP